MLWFSRVHPGNLRSSSYRKPCWLVWSLLVDCKQKCRETSRFSTLFIFSNITYKFPLGWQKTIRISNEAKGSSLIGKLKWKLKKPVNHIVSVFIKKPL